MKRKRFSVEQIVAVVKQAEMGLPVSNLILQVAQSRRGCSAGRVIKKIPRPALMREHQTARVIDFGRTNVCLTTI